MRVRQWSQDSPVESAVFYWLVCRFGKCFQQATKDKNQAYMKKATVLPQTVVSKGNNAICSLRQRIVVPGLGTMHSGWCNSTSQFQSGYSQKRPQRHTCFAYILHQLDNASAFGWSMSLCLAEAVASEGLVLPVVAPVVAFAMLTNFQVYTPDCQCDNSTVRIFTPNHSSQTILSWDYYRPIGCHPLQNFGKGPKITLLSCDNKRSHSSHPKFKRPRTIPHLHH